jgi:UDP-glucose 6-dehydrogenase
VIAYDPKAMEHFKDGKIMLAKNMEEAINKADAILAVTDWEEFQRFDAKGKIVIDGRRVNPKNCSIYEGICW